MCAVVRFAAGLTVFLLRRSAIEEWIQKKAVSPMTNGALEGKLYPNFSLKSRIAEWKQTHNAE